MLSLLLLSIAALLPQERPHGRELVRRELLGEVARSPGWRLRETGHYFVLTDSQDGEFVERLLERAEAYRTRVRELFPHPRLDPVPVHDRPSVIRMLHDSESYHSYGGPAASMNYWTSNERELVLYDMRGDEDDDTWASLQGVVVLEYLDTAFGQPPAHAWFRYGHADYLSRACLPRDAPRDGFRRQTIRAAVREGRYVPLQPFVRLSPAEYGGSNRWGLDSGTTYAQGWSLVAFLRTGSPAMAGWREEWSSILPRYFEIWSDGGDRDLALEAAFGGLDWQALERAWLAFVS